MNMNLLTYSSIALYTIIDMNLRALTLIVSSPRTLMGGQTFLYPKIGGVGRFFFWGMAKWGEVRKWGGIQIYWWYFRYKISFIGKLVENGYKTSEMLKTAF